MFFKARSLHIGLNSIDNTRYGTDGRLKGCENDAKFMFDLSQTLGFKSVLLQSSKVDEQGKNETNVERVISEIEAAVGSLEDDGVFLITYSGHGTQRKDDNRGVLDFEPDGLDEVWCLYNGVLIDDEIFELLTRFKKNQRVILISDSCHSGTPGDGVSSNFPLALGVNPNEILENAKPKYIEKSFLDGSEVFRSFQSIYKERTKSVGERLAHRLTTSIPVKTNINELVEANVIVISACQDWQLARDGNNLGAFTNALKDVWENDGGNNMNYLQIHEAIWKKLEGMSNKQNPNYTRLGPPNSKFELQTCFSIQPPS
jgi:metacaspase-1